MSAVPRDPVPVSGPNAAPISGAIPGPIPRATADPASDPAPAPADGRAALIVDRPPDARVAPNGIRLPRDMRSGPIVAGIDDARACGRPLRAAAFLALATGKPLLLVHVRRRAMPMVEGYVPIPEEIGANDEAENEVETELVAALTSSGDLTGVTWELVSTTGEAGAELVRIAEDRDAACVVVGKRHTGFSDLLHRIASGSVSRAVVARQKFPVLVVP